MPRGSKAKYTDKQDRKADHIAKGFRLVGDRRNRRGVASQQRQFAALGSESMRDGSAHPFGRACNHHDSILK